jgi:CRP/FNR family transcriptional regulator, cyclic AMP receptor protein
MSPSKERTFDPKTFLAQAGLGRTILQYPKNKVIFAQGEPCDAVFYIQAGRAKVTVLSTRGKEATIALLGAEDFLGESSITSHQPLRMSSATTITDCWILRIQKKAMLKVLHGEHAFSDLFVAYLVSRLEADSSTAGWVLVAAAVRGRAEPVGAWALPPPEELTDSL